MKKIENKQREGKIPDGGVVAIYPEEGNGGEAAQRRPRPEETTRPCRELQPAQIIHQIHAN